MNEKLEVNEILANAIREAQKAAYEKGIEFKGSIIFNNEIVNGKTSVTYSVTLESPYV